MNSEMTSPIGLAAPNIGARERELIGEVLASGVLALGPMCKRFEESLANMVGRQFGIACSSGTAGLHMVVRALGIGDGDEVITTPFSFVASSNCLLFERAVPKFVDIEDGSWGIDPDKVANAITNRTRALLPVHVFGNPCRIDALEAIARDRGLAVIEDSCEALGSRLGGRPAGSFGTASVFAFYPNKQITTGEGGMVVTDDPNLADVLRSLRNQGRDADGTWLRHMQLGFNYRMGELSAALGVAQMERLAELRAGRDQVVAWYRDALGERAWLRLPEVAPQAEVDWFVFVVRLDERIDRDLVVRQLSARGIASRPYFSPIHLQPFYASMFGFRPGDFPVTERLAASTLALPFSSRLKESEVKRVASALDDCVVEQLGH